MGWLDDKLSQSETLAWISASAGLSAFVPSIFWFKNGVDNAVCENINRKCGTQITTDQCTAFKSRYLKNVNGELSFSQIGNKAINALRHPIIFAKNFKNVWTQTISAIKAFDPKIALPFVAQESSYFIGSTALQFDIAFAVEHFGGNFLATLPFSILLCWSSTNVRRLLISWYVGQQLKYFGNPNQNVCNAIREFEAVPAIDFSEEPAVEDNKSYARKISLYPEIIKEFVMISAEMALILKIIELSKTIMATPVPMPVLMVAPSDTEQTYYYQDLTKAGIT